MITITINGEQKNFESSLSVAEVLEQLAVDPEMVVIEHNRTIINRQDFDKTMCQDNDKLEIVRFMGGG